VVASSQRHARLTRVSAPPQAAKPEQQHAHPQYGVSNQDGGQQAPVAADGDGGKFPAAAAAAERRHHLLRHSLTDEAKAAAAQLFGGSPEEGAMAIWKLQ